MPHGHFSRPPIFQGHPNFKTAAFLESGRDDRRLAPLALRAGSQFAANYIFEKGKFRPKYRRCSDKQILSTVSVTNVKMHGTVCVVNCLKKLIK
jgi:hypothetical protein